MRAAVLDALDARRDDVEQLEQASEAAPDPQVGAAVEQLRRVGVNLNQALRRAEMPHDKLVVEVRAAVDEVRASLGDRTAS